MQRARAIHKYTYGSYLECEAHANVKHEYLDGEIYAMAGGSRQHAAVAGNIITTLGAQTKRGPCVVYTSDLKVRIAASDLATYPDVTVICGPPQDDDSDTHVVVNPTVVVEVTSPSTEDWDRGEKLEHYKQCPSLLSVILVSHREQNVEIHERIPGGPWTLTAAAAGVAVLKSAVLKSIGCSLALDDVYRNTGIG